MVQQIVMDRTGDTQHQFNPQDAEAVAAASARFAELVGRGFLAIEPGPDGAPGKLLKSFDPEIETTVFQPQLVGG